jgi:hypothetical protein
MFSSHLGARTGRTCWILRRRQASDRSAGTVLSCCQDRLSPLCLIIFVGFENVSHGRVFAIGFTSFSVSFQDCLLLKRLGDDSGLFVCLTIFAQSMSKLLALAGPVGILFIIMNLPNFVPDGNQLLFQILLPTPW